MPISPVALYNNYFPPIMPEEPVIAVADALLQKYPCANDKFQQLPSYVRQSVSSMVAAKVRSDVEEIPHSELVNRTFRIYISQDYLPNLAQLFQNAHDSAFQRLVKYPRPIKHAIYASLAEIKGLRKDEGFWAFHNMGGHRDTTNQERAEAIAHVAANAHKIF